MGRYHNPADEVPNIGRQIFASKANDTIPLASLQRDLKSGETVVGHGSNGMWHVAPVLASQANVDEFYGQYRRGQLLWLNFYAVPTEKISD